MTNILVLFNVAFWLKEILTKCTVYSDIIYPQTLLLDEIRLTLCSPQAVDRKPHKLKEMGVAMLRRHQM